MASLRASSSIGGAAASAFGLAGRTASRNLIVDQVAVSASASVSVNGTRSMATAPTTDASQHPWSLPAGATAAPRALYSGRFSSTAFAATARGSPEARRLLNFGSRQGVSPLAASSSLSASVSNGSRGLHSMAASSRLLLRASDPTSRRALPTVNQSLQSRNVNVFAKFWESVQRQVKERQDFQENVKQLSATGEQIASSDLVKGAKAAAEVTGGAVKKIVDTTEKVLESEAVQKTVEVTAKVVTTVAKPVIDNPLTRTAASGAQALHEAVQDPESTATNRYSPYKPKEVRDAERLAREEKLKQEIAANPFLKSPDRPVEANSEAQGVVLHEQSRWAQSWEKFKETNPVMQKMFGLKSQMDESDNPVVERMRDVFDTIGRAFRDNETVTTVKKFKAVDPKFRTDKFVKDAHEWIIPDLMESYLRSDVEALKDWCGESTFSVLSAGIAAQKVQGLISDCKLLDVRNVELAAAKILDNDVPVLVVSFQTQEILLFRNLKGEVSVGKEDHIEHATYAAVFTRDQVMDPTIPINPRTKGWRVIDMAKHFSRQGL